MQNIQYALLGLLFGSLITACQKDQPLQQPLTGKASTATILVDGSNTSPLKSGNPDQILLGNDKPNPYAHDNVLAAWNAIYPNQQQTSLPISHVYLKLLPQDWDALEVLQDAVDAINGEDNPDYEHDPFLFNYPLHKEVLQEGIYYHDPSIANDKPTYQYLVVEPSFQVPAGVSSEILAELVEMPYNSYVMAEAFRRVGATYYDVNGYELNTCTPSCPNYPQCYDPAVPCSGGEVQPLPIPCNPPATWPHCNTIFIPTPSNPVPTPTNSCGCPISPLENQPSGCVQVEDTQLGWQGVRKIKVYVKDLYFFGKETWTDHEGCWQIPYSYFGGIHPYVDYYHGQMEARAMRGADITQLGRRLKQNCGTHGGGIYNDFQIYHPTFADNSSIRRTFWAASTSWNALYEFNGYAAEENITTPLVASSVGRLRIWLLNNAVTSGAAPMLSDINKHTQIYSIHQTFTTYFASMILPGASWVSWSSLTNLPDVVYNYGTSGLRSDDFTKLCYHEYAHVGHYRGLPSSDRYSYWMDNINRTLYNEAFNDNSPYGSDSTTGAGRMAIMEAWANHIEDVFADRRYGIERQRSRVRSTINEKRKERYIYWFLGVEQFDPNSGDPDAWIPVGVFWDLYDDDVHNQLPLEIPDPVSDNVQGISNQTMFQAITQNAPIEMIDVRNAIRANAGGNTPAQIDSLFAEYGY